VRGTTNIGQATFPLLGSVLSEWENLSIADRSNSKLPYFPPNNCDEYKPPNVTPRTYQLLCNVAPNQQERAKDICAGVSSLLKDRGPLPRIAWFGVEGGLVGDAVAMMMAHRLADVDVGLISSHLSETDLHSLVKENHSLKTFVSSRTNGVPLVRGRQYMARRAAELAASTEVVRFVQGWGSIGMFVRSDDYMELTYPITPMIDAGEIVIGVEKPSESALEAFLLGVKKNTNFTKAHRLSRRNTFDLVGYQIPWHFERFLDRAILDAIPFLQEDFGIVHRAVNVAGQRSLEASRTG
jgi:hypothetical protein